MDQSVERLEIDGSLAPPMILAIQLADVSCTARGDAGLEQEKSQYKRHPPAGFTFREVVCFYALTLRVGFLRSPLRTPLARSGFA